MRLAAAVSVAVLALVVPASAGAEPDAYILIKSDSNPVGALERFDTANPSSATLASAVAITGTSGARVLGIDYRPANRVLYGIAENSKLYSINPATGAATQIGGPGSTTLDPFTGPPGPNTPFAGIGIDFDPVNDRLRVIEDDGATNGQDDNFSVDPNTGVFTQQGDLGGPRDGPGRRRCRLHQLRRRRHPDHALRDRDQPEGDGQRSAGGDRSARRGLPHHG